MPANISNYAELKILEHAVGKTAWNIPSCYVALYTVAPGEAGGGTEVPTSGTGYARQQVLPAGWATAANGAITTATNIDFPQASADWNTIVALALLDALTGGNPIWYGPLAVNKTVTTGDIFRIPAGSLTLGLD